MQNFFGKIKEFFSNLWNKTSMVAKIIIGAAILGVIILIVVLVSTSAKPDMVPLVKEPMTEGDFNRVKQELDALGENYMANSNTRKVYVTSPQKAEKLRTQLTIEDKMQDVDGYELFDEQSFTTTEFDRNVNLQRSMMKAMEEHLEMLDDVENAEVEISFPKIEDDLLWADDDLNDPLTASVIITPAPGSEITEDNKRIKGIQKLISRGVDGLNPDHVSVFDYKGNELTARETAEDQKYNELLNMNSYKQRLRREARIELEGILKPVFKDGFTLAINNDIDLESGEKVERIIEPIILREDNPDTPTDESQVIEAVPISENIISETYRGQLFIPEGSPSPDFTIPPGAKQVSDQYNTYTKEEKTKNNEVSTKDIVREDPAGDQLFINVSVLLDYTWEWERDPETNEIIEDPITRTRSRIYTPVEQEKIDNIRRQIEAYISRSDKANAGKVSVETIPFSITKEKHKMEDEEYFRRKDTQKALMYGAIALGILILIILLFFWIRGIIRERRRRREEELARQRQAMREAALRAAEQEGVILDMSPEDKARLEMQENAIRLARERPEDVAKLLRTWIAED